MHLDLEWTRVNAFRFGSDPVQPIWAGLNPANAPVTGPSQWPGWAKQHARTKFTHVTTLFKWIKIHLNSVMLIKEKQGGRWKLSTFLFIYSAPSPLTISAWCWSWTLSLFSPAPHSPSSSSSALPCLHCSREQWRHGSVEEDEKTCASSY
jgi:hypothetical protein